MSTLSANPHPRATFTLHRSISGVSGLGVVAEGVQFSDGTVVLRWRGTHASTVVWSSLASALAVHGHGATTIVAWDGPHGEQLPADSWQVAVSVPLSTTAAQKGDLFEALAVATEAWKPTERDWEPFIAGYATRPCAVSHDE